MAVSVTNRGERFVGRFDGREYAFEPQAPMVIPERVAAFLFAYGMDDSARTRVLVRNGWQKNGDPKHAEGPAGALKRLQSFTFRAVEDPPRKKPEPQVLNPKILSANIPGRSEPLAPTATAA